MTSYRERESIHATTVNWYWCWTLPAVLWLPGCGAPADEWNRFRGADGSGLIRAESLPAEWSTERGIRWRTELRGVGNSSPVASRGRVFLTAAWEHAENPDRKWRAVSAFDARDGGLLWEREIFAAEAEEKHQYNTIAAPTPASDSKRVYVYFGSTLAALDHDGEILWQREIDPTYAEFARYGAASSPVLTREAVIVVQDKEWGDTEDVAWLAAFSKKTGDLLWRREWTETCCSYSTPVVVDRGAGEEIVFSGSGAVVSYSAADGETLWTHEVETNQMVGSPVFDGDLLAVAGGAHNVRSINMLRLTGAGRQTIPETLWTRKRLAPQDSSPVLVNGRLYTVTDQGIMASHDAKSGQLIWRGRLERSRMRASLVAGAGKIFATSTSGAVFAVSASDEFEILSINDFEERGTNASPGIAPGCLLFRTRSHLWCVDTAPSVNVGERAT